MTQRRRIGGVKLATAERLLILGSEYLLGLDRRKWKKLIKGIDFTEPGLPSPFDQVIERLPKGFGNRYLEEYTFDHSTKTPVPRSREAAFNQTYDSPLGIYTPSREGGRAYWHLFTHEKERALIGSVAVAVQTALKEDISSFFRIEQCDSSEVNRIMSRSGYFSRLTEGVEENKDAVHGGDYDGRYNLAEGIRIVR